jgi:SAM-dependent methyltransferase
MGSDVFERYGAYYDLLYRDKDYAAESDYVAQTLRSAAPETRSLLEFGSGTGHHGRLLAARGFKVTGIERSKSMIAAARRISSANGGFDCQEGDIGTTHLDRTFDAVIALFHVLSYQTSDAAIERTFANAASHLNPGGLFLFDVWHGPAVLKKGPSVRTKEVEDATTKLTRTAVPKLDSEKQIVVVRYEIVAKSIPEDRTDTFQEEHRMRYFFPEEIKLLADRNGFVVERCEELVTARPPSDETWAVCYLLRKV